jgi:hypothetical protein
MQCCAGFRQPADIFTVQALRTTDPQIRCVRAQCARRAAAQVGPDTGTSAHAHTQFVNCSNRPLAKNLATRSSMTETRLFLKETKNISFFSFSSS